MQEAQQIKQASPSLDETVFSEEAPQLPEETEVVQAGEQNNHNQMILEKYRDGKSAIEIAKELGLGVGEVRLVIGLFREEEL